MLVVGLTLPVVLMLGFFAAASLPESLSDPPKYDLVFSVLDYQAASSVPVERAAGREGRRADGAVHEAAAVQGATPAPGGGSSTSTRRRPHACGSSSSASRRTSTRSGRRAKTPWRPPPGCSSTRALQSPDGYELSFGDRSGGGLLGEIFSARASREPRLRKGGQQRDHRHGRQGAPLLRLGRVRRLGDRQTLRVDDREAGRAGRGGGPDPASRPDDRRGRGGARGGPDFKAEQTVERAVAALRLPGRHLRVRRPRRLRRHAVGRSRPAGRVLLTLGPGLCLFVFALVCTTDARFERRPRRSSWWPRWCSPPAYW